MPDILNSGLQKDNSATEEGSKLASRNELNDEAYRAMHDKSIAPEQAMFQIDKAFTKAESESSAQPVEPLAVHYGDRLQEPELLLLVRMQSLKKFGITDIERNLRAYLARSISSEKMPGSF